MERHSFSLQQFSSFVGEHRLIGMSAAGPEGNARPATPPPMETTKTSPDKKPESKEAPAAKVEAKPSTPEKADTTVKAAARTEIGRTENKVGVLAMMENGATAIADKVGYKLMRKDMPATGPEAKAGAEKPKNASSKTEAPEKREGELKAPETQEERLSQKFDQLTQEYDAALESGDKNKQFAAVIKTIALVIEYIVRAFNGTLGDKLDKAKDDEAPKDGEKPKEGEAAKGGGAAAGASPEAATKAAVDTKLNGQPATPEKTQAAAREVREEAGKDIEANKTEIAERNKSIDGLKKENGEFLDAQHKLEEQLNGLEGKQDPASKGVRSKLETDMKAIKGKIDINKNAIKEHSDKITSLTETNKTLDAKMKAAEKMEKGMDKMKVWMPIVEKMIATTLGLRLGAGGITVNSEGKLNIDLRDAPEQESAMTKLKDIGAEKSGDKAVTVTQEQIAKAIAGQLPGAPEEKTAGASGAAKGGKVEAKAEAA
ncbi:MAG: hypothetical protein PHO54_06320, partial [Candidatus Peribacteraceae bacterium]|nr:hypothetical protein [Candidatus Peribacteraceae bacterium]